jgi:hypothetical protein
MLRRPSELIQVRPFTESRRSVPSAQAQLVRARQALDQPRLQRPELAPARHRVVVEEEHRAVDEALEVVQAHAGVLRGGVGGVERADPARARHRQLLHRLRLPGEARHPPLVGGLERPGVRRRRHPDARVEPPRLLELDHRLGVEVGVGRQLQDVLDDCG